MDPHAINKISSFFQKFPIRQYKQKQVLLYIGDKPQNVFFILGGDVRIYDIAKSGDEIVLKVHQSGSMLPVALALSGRASDYFYGTGSNVTANVAPIEDFVSFLKSEPLVGYELLRDVYSGIDNLYWRIKYLMKGSAQELIIVELIISCDLFGKKNDGGYFIEIPESEFAARTGLSRETISREMHKLQNKGLIKINYKSVTVFDAAKLRKELS